MGHTNGNCLMIFIALSSVVVQCVLRTKCGMDGNGQPFLRYIPLPFLVFGWFVTDASLTIHTSFQMRTQPAVFI